MKNTTRKLLILFLLSISFSSIGQKIPRKTLLKDIYNNTTWETPLFNNDISEFNTFIDGRFSSKQIINDSLTNIRNSINSKPSINYTNQKLHFVNSKTELLNVDINVITKVRFDNSDWYLQNGNVASNGGNYNGTIINVSSSFYWERKVEKDILPEWFGAVGDNNSDDVIALNLAATASSIAKKNLLITKKHIVSGIVFIRNGTKKVYGGGTLKITSNSNNIVIYLLGIGEGASENVVDCTIENLIIDCNNKSNNIAGIRGTNISNCIIQNNKIINISANYGILVQTLSNGIDIAQNNIIINNKINAVVDLNTNAVVTEGIGITSEFNILPYTTMPDHWKNTFTAPTSSLKSKKNIVSNNIIEGGYYGIILSASDENIIHDNIINNNIRNIMINNICYNNTIRNNNLQNSLSTNISLSYSSSFNNIINNIVKNDIGTGESIMQAYVNCKGNKFIDNKIECTTPEFILYTAVHSDDTEFINNRLIGNPSKAYIGVESAWKTTTTNYYHSRYNKDILTNNYANAGMSGVKIIDNYMKGTSNFACQIELTQISDAGGNFPLTNTIIKNNKFSLIGSYQLFLWEDVASNLNTIELENNYFPTNSLKANYVLPRDRSHFSLFTNNSKLDYGIGYEGLTGATPNVSTSYNFTFNDTSTTNVTNFLGGLIGQKIKVRMNVNDIIIHNNSFIRLKNSTNVNGNSNNFIEFENISGIWFEINRNF